MIDFLMILVFVAVILAPLYVAVTVALVLKRAAKKYKNPLTHNLRRPPGGTLHRMLQGAYINQVLPVVILAMAVSIPVSMHLFQSYVLEKPESFLRTAMLIVLVLGISMYAIIGLMRGKRQISNLALGYECELAVGQALDLLMLDGFRVFHDIDGGSFNVDHVVVGPTGVFAVETKGKSKILGTAGKQKATAKVEYINGQFHFPGGIEKEWVKQAKRQATWLKGWLSKAVGFEFFVQPVIVVAGWYVATESNHPVKAISSGQIDYYFQQPTKQSLSKEQINRIAYQLDQKTRDLEPGEVRVPIEESF